MALNGFADVVDMEGFYTGLAPRDRSNIEKHLAACDAEETPDHGRLWRRLALGMRRMVPTRLATTGKRAVQFFAADGKYRVQVFALEDARDGTLALYAADALDAAVAAGVLCAPVGAGDGATPDALLYEVCDLPGVTIKVEPLSAATSSAAPDYYRHMVGWNRKAVRITLPVDATPAQVRACEALLALAAGAPARD